jgi:hypothetical protein
MNRIKIKQEKIENERRHITGNRTHKGKGGAAGQSTYTKG